MGNTFQADNSSTGFNPPSLLWLRAETKPFEQRCALVPDDVQALIQAGFQIVVEESQQSCFSIDEYNQLGCKVASAGSWRHAPKDALIIGLKELEHEDIPLYHRQVYFAHVYKSQSDSGAILDRFRAGGGQIWDWEFLTNDQAQRLIAFGYWAGFAGALIAVNTWLFQQGGHQLALKPTTKSQAITGLQDALSYHHTAGVAALIIGALGRSGRGAQDCLKQLGLSVTCWDQAETRLKGPYAEILDYPLLINTVLASPKTGVFLDHDTLKTQKNRHLSVIADVSCDPNSPYNPLPIYEQATTFDSPLYRLQINSKPLDIIAIDHLPAFLPRESSIDFSAQALPLLLKLKNKELSAPWVSCLDRFYNAMN